MQETFKGEALILEKIKSAAKKAHEKQLKANAELCAIEQRLNGFGFSIHFTTGEITEIKK